MKTKEEYYVQVVLKNRELAANPEIMKCTCPNTLCEWHGKCRECVGLHRYHNDHIPACLHGILDDKLKSLVKVTEMSISKKDATPLEYRQYVLERDKAEENS